VDDAITYDAPWVKNQDANPSTDIGLIDTLRARRFDAAVIFTVYSQSPLPAALICRLAGIPRVLAHCRENPYQLLSDWAPETEPREIIKHESQRQLDLVARIGASCKNERLSFTTRNNDRHTLERKLASRRVTPEQGWIVVHCGATAPSRRYPPDRFAQALKRLGNRVGPIIMTGDASERGLVERVAHQSGPDVPIINLSGELSLGEFACLIENASLLLSNNTGPVHLAAALQTPVVDLYALTNPQHTPWMTPHRLLFYDVPCKYCYRSVCPQHHHDCLARVSHESVCDAVLDLLLETGARADQGLLKGKQVSEHSSC
jgi:ADP-heptose:LPS heptosyltransferase